MDLKTVNLDVILFADFLLQQKSFDWISLVTLKLQNLSSSILVFQHRSVAAMLFLDSLQNAFQVECLRESSDGGDGLTTVALLDADVHVTLL